MTGFVADFPPGRDGRREPWAREMRRSHESAGLRCHIHSKVRAGILRVSLAFRCVFDNMLAVKFAGPKDCEKELQQKREAKRKTSAKAAQPPGADRTALLRGCIDAAFIGGSKNSSQYAPRLYFCLFAAFHQDEPQLSRDNPKASCASQLPLPTTTKQTALHTAVDKLLA